MMIKNNVPRLWRVTPVHRDGYYAPRFYVETQHPNYDKAKLEALTKAKEKSRLGDFPKKWSFRVENNI